MDAARRGNGQGALDSNTAAAWGPGAVSSCCVALVAVIVASASLAIRTAAAAVVP